MGDGRHSLNAINNNNNYNNTGWGQNNNGGGAQGENVEELLRQTTRDNHQLKQQLQHMMNINSAQ